MSVYQSFTYSPTDLAEQLTGATHDTLSWLVKHQYLTQEQYNELSDRIVVMAVPNKKGFGRRLIERFFGNNKDETMWVFPIVEVASHYLPTQPEAEKPKNVSKMKPKLSVVKDDKAD